MLIIAVVGTINICKLIFDKAHFLFFLSTILYFFLLQQQAGINSSKPPTPPRRQNLQTLKTVQSISISRWNNNDNVDELSIHCHLYIHWFTSITFSAEDDDDILFLVSKTIIRLTKGVLHSWDPIRLKSKNITKRITDGLDNQRTHPNEFQHLKYQFCYTATLKRMIFLSRGNQNK